MRSLTLKTLGHAAMAATAGLVATAPSTAEARWPRLIEVEICWDNVCNGTFTTWRLKRDGTFTDSYGIGGQYFAKQLYPVWPYAEDFLLFYDNGETTYAGDFGANGLTGTMITYHFYPPYIIEGRFCQGGC